MYLKKIIASGFKSFADKTIIDLSNGITGIVGPNGSGKSNVVDAIRWVLGEQSIKSLRGDMNMTDVIFSGSKSRNAMNVASVTLIFDNSDHYLNLNFDEIAIRRRVYKDGTNEYFINHEKCRLKDIIDLFLDSGTAKESFNIISQGKIEEIINSKPSERRIILEEAASVLKYKKRKEEALRKLDRTHNNMSRVNDIMNELESQVLPLKEQKEKAILYKQKQGELENIEVALITSDITSINVSYQRNKEKIDILNKELEQITTSHTTGEVQTLEYKNQISSLEEKISKKNQELLEKNHRLEQINREKILLTERQKYEVEDAKLQQNVVALKEESLKLESNIKALKLSLASKEKELKNKKEEIERQDQKLGEKKEQKRILELSLQEEVRKQTFTKNKINNLENNIENNSSLPYAVKMVLQHPKLKGIYDTIGNVIEVEEKYMVALSIALGFSSSYLIVEDETAAKEAIEYLKQESLGRATFFPLSVIQKKAIDPDTLLSLTDMTGFIGVLTDLIKYQGKYANVIENQLGNIIVADTLQHANEMSRKIHHRYRIVTLEGELLHVGGSLTGGKNKINKNIIMEKNELEKELKNLEVIEDKIKTCENQINECDYDYQNLEDKRYLFNRDKVNIEQEIKEQIQVVEQKEDELQKLNSELTGNQGILEKNMNHQLEKVLTDYYQALDDFNHTKEELENLQKEKLEKREELEEKEFLVRKENALFNNKSKELKELEIEVNRMDVKLDHLLTKLSETYSITYEKAITIYTLNDEIETSRNRVNTLRREIRELGEVNLGSIEEYDRVNERYQFLNTQKEDLVKAEDTLLEIIHDMDQVMEQEFESTFKVVRENFKETFRELFKGGDADLKLTDPSNMLETGIEIVASPPGKTLKNISALSGGEKTFTAISLLFAILKSRTVPYCILDEVEAALDEVNVDSFGTYLKNLKEKTQFILITHKKKTMEYADYLYGITMQESGVSKLVSVKLEELK